MIRKFNLHHGNTVEFNVKNPPNNITDITGDIDKQLENIFITEDHTGHQFTNNYVKECYSKITDLGYYWIDDFELGGRSGGWFILFINVEENEIPNEELLNVENIIDEYYKNYLNKIYEHYNHGETIKHECPDCGVRYDVFSHDNFVCYNCEDMNDDDGGNDVE